jgi:hypothetical protein
VGLRAETPRAESETADTTKEVKYLRVRRDARKQPIALETAITRYVGKRGDSEVFVDLVGAVHVGEGQYYEKLNELFRSYDSVLYELVAPEGTRVVPGSRGKSRHPVNFLQNVMKDVLKLDFQLDCINYASSNMVHADMSPTEFSRSMKDRNESFLKMFLRAMGQTMAAQATQKTRAPSDMELLVALVAKDRDYRLKRIMAEQFENMETQLSAINGPDGSTIITERNKKALQVLKKQLAKGKQRLAIFYGAGHLPDMAERLEQDFGMKFQKQRWLTAWEITPPESEEIAPKEESEQEDASEPEQDGEH